MSTQPQALLANLTPTATVLSPDRSRSMTFDREGRLLFYFRCGETFKRSLGSELHLRFRRGGRQRRRLTGGEAREIFLEVHELVSEIRSRTQGEVGRRLDREILPWTPKRLEAERERFRSAYPQPIAILPPDQYLAIVLQATEGCTWNGCTFCNFYMGHPFRVKAPHEFARHASAVRALFGRALGLRRGVFLGDGNALALSNRHVEPLIRTSREMFPDRRLYGFVDLYSGERRPVHEWRRLGEQGLTRVYIGMETGLDELLRFVNKPGSAEDLKDFVQRLKAARLEVSLIVIVGLGGREFRVRHGEATRELLLRLPLDGRDLVYLSPFVEHRDSSYRERRIEAGLTPMSEEEVDSEIARLAASLRSCGLRASRYDIREFIY